jgi:hypothetical protein
MPDGILEPPMPRPSQPEPLPWSPTTRCVACAYNLHGLSLPALCPECGVPNAERAIVFRERLIVNVFVAVANTLAAMVFFASVVHGESWGPFALFAAASVLHWFALSRPREALVITPDAVYTMRGPAMADTVPLGDVAEVKRSFLGSEVMLLKADGSVTWTTPAQFLTTTARTREVARVLERVLAERAARVSLDTQGTR